MSNGAADLLAEGAASEFADSPIVDNDPNSIRITLADLCAKGASHYATKNYSEAVDHYAQASELQAELNGEMSPENAEILFLYGRSLYKVGQSKSDVLGVKSGGEKKKKLKPIPTMKPKPKAAELEENGEAIAEPSDQDQASSSKSKAEENAALKPFFQFTGDENFEDSEDEEEAEHGEDAEEEEDDLQLAFEILEVARVLFERKLQQQEEEEQDAKGKGKAEDKVEDDSSIIKHMRERLADTHDLLGEISLENERFPSAVGDFKASLAYKKQLYPKEDELIAEAHFKLSLALEFGSITTTSDADDGNEQKEAVEATVNEEMRTEAADQLELAIECTRLKLHSKEVSLAETSSPEDNDKTKAQIVDVKEMLVDLEQRLLDLRAPPVDVGAVLGGASNGAGSIAGTKEGETRAETEARVEEAKKNAKNIQGVIRKKVPKAETGSNESESSNGKRKAEEEAENEPKKTKVEEESMDSK